MFEYLKNSFLNLNNFIYRESVVAHVWVLAKVWNMKNPFWLKASCYFLKVTLLLNKSKLNSGQKGEKFPKENKILENFLNKKKF